MSIMILKIARKTQRGLVLLQIQEPGLLIVLFWYNKTVTSQAHPRQVQIQIQLLPGLCLLIVEKLRYILLYLHA